MSVDCCKTDPHLTKSTTAYDKAKILNHLELFVSNEQLAMHTPVMKTSTSIASNNENTKIWKHQRVHMLQT